MMGVREGGKKKGRGQGVALCHVFPWFTIAPLKQLYTLVNTSEGWSQTKQTLWVETTCVVFSLRVGLRQDWGVLGAGGVQRKSHIEHGAKQDALQHLVECVIKHNIGPSHCQDCQGPRAHHEITLRCQNFALTTL